MTFTDAARRLAGQAGVLIGWPPDTFWRATPDELATALEALGGDAPPRADASDVRRLMEMFPDG